MVTAYLATLLFIVCLTAGIYFFGYAARRANAFYVTALEVIVGNFLIIPIILFEDKLSLQELFTRPKLENWLWLGAASVTGFIGGNFFSIINLKTAGEKTNSLLSPAITACIVLASSFIFKEIFSYIKIIGIIITLSSIFVFLLVGTKNKYNTKNTYEAFWSGIMTILCITATVIFSIIGTMHTKISIMHSIWIRLFIAFMLPILFLSRKNIIPKSIKFYGAITSGVIVQTIIASSLWFYCTYKIGISTFQVLIATLPFFVYATDVFLFKRTKPSLYFLLIALFAVMGIWLIMN